LLDLAAGAEQTAIYGKILPGFVMLKMAVICLEIYVHRFLNKRHTNGK